MWRLMRRAGLRSSLVRARERYLLVIVESDFHACEFICRDAIQIREVNSPQYIAH